MLGAICTGSGRFKHIERHPHRDSQVYRVLLHEFGVVRLNRTFSDYIFRGDRRSAGCLCTSSEWFKHIEPHRTLSNNIIAEIARCVEFCHMSSGGSTVLYLHRFRYAECLYTSAGWFQHIEPHRTFSNHIITQIARCVEFCHMSSGGSTVLYLHRFRGNKVCRVLIH